MWRMSLVKKLKIGRGSVYNGISQKEKRKIMAHIYTEKIAPKMWGGSQRKKLQKF